LSLVLSTDSESLKGFVPARLSSLVLSTNSESLKGFVPARLSSLVSRPYLGVSFTESQKIPVWIMELENASNSTGFTTYPLAPRS
jgi:hypothetical protein